jgi:hypothetical protein
LNEESRPKTASENSAGGRVHLNSTVARFLAGEIQPHELPWPLPLVWNDGFRAGQARAQVRIDRADRAADLYYDLAFNGDEARKRHAELLKHFDVMQARKAVTA